jgi:hypothetical protein
MLQINGSERETKNKIKKIQNDMTSLGIAVPHQIHLKMSVEGSFLKRGALSIFKTTQPRGEHKANYSFAFY